MSKKYKGKECAYCGSVSRRTIGEHVLAREFFEIEDRMGLPKVSGCERCNTRKSDLESYAAIVLPLGSRHVDATSYLEANLTRRLRGNRKAHRAIALTMRPALEIQPSGLAVPTVGFTVDTPKILRLFETITKGLFRHEYGYPLHSKWISEAQISDATAEAVLMNSIAHLLGDGCERRERDFGRGKFVYRSIRSSHFRFFSVWHYRVFGGARLTGDPHFPEKSFSQFTCVTRPPTNTADLTDDDLGFDRERYSAKQI